ncbi:hypothetical protein [Brytella acorum]|uniref:Uncharacterized protein n=1 Tax=Brytella acorum TaxID=2959299 RepID=A0AA35ULE4_9PROT|nr:hypothetical protein [Brytella acorum]MDF3624563.1 hypothetical protein [Brytella acorum]CAI9119588.1 hypothetical protein LMG32879_000406 [Brytella acorum]
MARLYRSVFRFSVSTGAIAAALALNACAPLDQRTFDPSAGRPPKVHVPLPPPAPPAKPPFVQIMAGTPESVWQPDVEKVTRLALQRKPNILFVLTAIVPRDGSPPAQADALAALVQGDERAVAQAMVDAGASGGQIEMDARVEDGAKPHIRVDVR